MRARLLFFFCVLIAALLLPTAVSSAPAGAADGPSLRPFRGLGTWVDVYDYGPAFQGRPGYEPAVTVASIDDMARLGVKTLYLQAAQDDTRSTGLVADKDLVGRMLRRAHRRGIKVVAWYLPHFGDVDRDLRYVRALYEFRSGGQKFDGIALDIEWTSDVKDTGKRNDALLSLARRTHALVTSMPLGAIVLEPVLLEKINTNYWPNFPWRKLEPFFDVWLPMSYWTFRSDYRGGDAFQYTRDNIQGLRKNLGDRKAPVHVIGGIADKATPDDYRYFVNTAKINHAIGWSVYDYVTTSSSAWPRLRG
jgi:hypothetical protein